MTLTVTGEVFPNQYLTSGAKEVDFVLYVQAQGSVQAAAAAVTRVFGFGIDTSTSMETGNRIGEARNAVDVALGLLQPQDWFFVVKGSSSGEVLVRLQQATPENVASARQLVRRLGTSGGTAISTWLDQMHTQFTAARRQLGDGCFRQGVLLTDGKNEGESAAVLTAILNKVEGSFQCDCRGVGTDWNVNELTGIANKLLGTADIVAKPADLAADFTAIMQKAQSKTVADVTLSVWTPAGAHLAFMKQTVPSIVDITDKAKVDPAKPLIGNFPTGAWGTEVREYHGRIMLPEAGALGEPRRAGRVSLIYTVNGAPTTILDKNIVVTWIDDQQMSTILSDPARAEEVARNTARIARASGDAELAKLIQEGTAALRKGQEGEATSKLGKAMQIAKDSGNTSAQALLERVVEVDDAKGGTVRLKRGATEEDKMTLETRSSKTSRLKK